MTRQRGSDDVTDAKLRSFADSTTMLLISRVGMAFVPILTAAMMWVASSINALQIDVSVMKNQISTGIEDRYHGSDAVKDFALRDEKIGRNAADLMNLTSRLNQIERRQLGPGFRP